MHGDVALVALELRRHLRTRCDATLVSRFIQFAASEFSCVPDQVTCTPCLTGLYCPADLVIHSIIVVPKHLTQHFVPKANVEDVSSR